MTGGTGALVDVPENGGVIATGAAAARALAASVEGAGAELGGAVSCGLKDCGSGDVGATAPPVLDGAVIATGSSPMLVFAVRGRGVGTGSSGRGGGVGLAKASARIRGVEPLGPGGRRLTVRWRGGVNVAYGNAPGSGSCNCDSGNTPGTGIRNPSGRVRVRRTGPAPGSSMTLRSTLTLGCAAPSGSAALLAFAGAREPADTLKPAIALGLGSAASSALPPAAASPAAAIIVAANINRVLPKSQDLDKTTMPKVP